MSDPQQAPAQVPSKRIQDLAIGATMIFSLGFGIFIFVYLPNLLSQFFQRAGAD